MTIGSVITAWSCATISGRQSNFIHQSFVTLSRLSLQSEKYVPDVFNDLGSDALVEERCSQDLEDESGSAGMVGQDSLEGFVILREKQSLKDYVSGIRLQLLVDYLEDGQVRDLVSAKMDQVRDQLRCEN